MRSKNNLRSAQKMERDSKLTINGNCATQLKNLQQKLARNYFNSKRNYNTFNKSINTKELEEKCKYKLSPMMK